MGRVQEYRDALKGARSLAVADHSLRMGPNEDWSNIKILVTLLNRIYFIRKIYSF